MARADVMGILRPLFAARSRKHWIDVLSAAGVPCGPINAFDDVFADPQIQARGAVVTFADTPVGDIRVLGNPLQFSRTPAHPTAPPIGLGSTTIDPVAPDAVWR
jgi:crotonobetainyl-CoA:carnitine CoA-transferase CaiB-like acyl-CoA transferase